MPLEILILRSSIIFLVYKIKCIQCTGNEYIQKTNIEANLINKRIEITIFPSTKCRPCYSEMNIKLHHRRINCGAGFMKKIKVFYSDYSFAVQNNICNAPPLDKKGGGAATQVPPPYFRPCPVALLLELD